MGAGRSSEVERSRMVRWVVGSILRGVDPLNYFSFQPVFHDWCILVERYEIFERQEAPTTCHVVDVSVLQSYIMNKHLRNRFQTATATATNTPMVHNNRINAQTVRNRLQENGLHA